ncbi:MAG: HEAT repeat domain-containing protein [Firmicutes bacterium]|nr:HEAT repeat domain-containing protein [Bacillota bacterium]
MPEQPRTAIRRASRSTGRSAARHLIPAVLLALALAGCSRAERIAEPARGSVFADAVGDQATYAVSYANSSSSDFTVLFRKGGVKVGTGPLSSNRYETSLHADLTETVVRLATGGAVVDERWRSPLLTFNVNGAPAPEQAASIAEGTRTDAFATMVPDGAISSLRFDPAVTPLGQSYEKTVLALLEFVTPRAADAAACTWQTRESDPNGAYAARYEARPCPSPGAPPGPVTYWKTQLRYEPRPSSPGAAQRQLPMTVIPSGHLVAVFDWQNHRLTSLDGVVTETILISGMTVGHSRTEIHVRLLRVGTAPAGDLAAMQQYDQQLAQAPGVPMFAAGPNAALESSVQRSTLGSDTRDSLLAKLAAAEGKPFGPSDTQLYLKFKALVYLHPEAAVWLGDFVQSAHARGNALQIVAGALGNVGNEQAQAALVEAIRARSGNPRTAAYLITMLAQAPAPTTASVRALEGLAFGSPAGPLAQSARPSLGTMALHLRSRAPARAADIVDRLVEALNAAGDDDERIELLAALGNAGSNRALPAIDAMLTAANPNIRGTAISALRWAPSPEAETALARALTSDPAAIVRLQAATALSDRAPTAATFAAERRAFAKDTNVLVRIRALADIWANRHAFGQARTIVKRAVHDRSADVRKAARALTGERPQ